MGDKIEITIFSCTPLISDLHETVTSLINQLSISRLNISVVIDNPSGLPVDIELSRLKSAGFKIGPEKSPRFTLALKSGEVVSKSFLYKASEYLSLNTVGFVCPEYTFKRVSFCPILTAVYNANLPINLVSGAVIDHSKIGKKVTPLSTTIKDTCIATSNIEADIHQYIKSLPKDAPLISPFLTPLCLQDTNSNTTTESSKLRLLKASLRKATISLSGRSRLLRKLFACPAPHDRHRLPNSHYTKQTIYISNQLQNELAFLADCKYAIKGYESMTFANITGYINKGASELFASYQCIIKNLRFDHYNYICVLPWLISGGIDLFAVNYIKTISRLHPDYKLLVLLTNDFHKSFTKTELGLSDNIDFLNLPEALGQVKNKDLTMERLIHTLISTFSPEYLHIIASKIGYNVVIEAGDDFRKQGTKLLFSSYNYLVGPHYEYMGYTVEELPKAYRPGDVVTTDNSKTKSIWINQYGFREEDIFVHNQLFENAVDISPSSKNGIRILWAAHVRPEKNPGILLPIASALQKDNIEIDCYGLFVKDNWQTEENPFNNAPKNLHYMGPYNNFFTDINLSDYDLFLYTSHADGTPNVILEAALAGLPIVSSAIGGIPEATDGKATLVNDSYSKEEFIAAIRHALAHHEETLKNATALKAKLRTAHSKETFENQVKQMLKRNQNV